MSLISAGSISLDSTFNDTVSQEEHKTVYSGLRIIGVLVQSVWITGVTSPRKVKLKIKRIRNTDKISVPDLVDPY